MQWEVGNEHTERSTKVRLWRRVRLRIVLVTVMTIAIVLATVRYDLAGWLGEQIGALGNKATTVTGRKKKAAKKANTTTSRTRGRESRLFPNGR